MRIIVALIFLLQVIVIALQQAEIQQNSEDKQIESIQKVAEDCYPSDPTVFFGKSFTLQPSTELFQIRFNTKDRCTKSYIQISQNSFIHKTQCFPDYLSIKKTVNGTEKTFFERYVQKCSITAEDDFQLGSKFEYKVFGQSSDGKLFPYTFNPIISRIYDPKSKQSLELIVVADWSQMYTQSYTSLQASFDYLLNRSVQSLEKRENKNLRKQLNINQVKNQILASNQSQIIDGIFINGDIAYDLQTKDGVYYLDFMKMLGQISPYLPIILTPGNHERYTKLSFDLMNITFQIFDMGAVRHQALNFGFMGFVLFDPFEQIYQKSTAQKRQKFLQDISSDIQGLKTKLTAPYQIIAASHYPLLCSEPESHCLSTLQQIPQVFTLLNDHNVSLYIGAHMHQYQRLYPYYHNKFSLRKGPYVNEMGLISIVQAAAPNQLGLVDIWYPKFYFSVEATHNVTGFGLFKGYYDNDNNTINFQHYKTIDYRRPFDSVQIIRTMRA